MGVERIRNQPELETIGPQPTSPVSAPFTMSLRERKKERKRKGGGEKETSSRPSGARKFCPKFSNITIPSIFPRSPLRLLFPREGTSIFNRARERVSSRAPPSTTHARRSTQSEEDSG